MTHLPAAQAQVRFLPGDAFFATQIDFATAERWRHYHDASTLSLTYCTPTPKKQAFEISAGFLNLEIPNGGHLARQCARSFRDIFALTDDDLPHAAYIKQTAWVLVYSKEFDFRAQRLFLKYNDAWRSLRMDAFGPADQSQSGFYRPFVAHATLITEDWARSGRVPRLPAVVPADVEWRKIGPPLIPPCRLDPASVCLVVVPEDEMRNVSLQKHDSKFHRITQSHREEWHREKTRWKVEQLE